jgi:hypothetical protein
LKQTQNEPTIQLLSNLERVHTLLQGFVGYTRGCASAPPRKTHAHSKGKSHKELPAFAKLITILAKAQGLLSGTAIRGPLTKGRTTLSKCKLLPNPDGLTRDKTHARPKACHGPAAARAHPTRAHAHASNLWLARGSRPPSSQSLPRSREQHPSSESSPRSWNQHPLSESSPRSRDQRPSSESPPHSRPTLDRRHPTRSA